jgi:lysophospholipase L1-like esterase
MVMTSLTTIINYNVTLMSRVFKRNLAGFMVFSAIVLFACTANQTTIETSMPTTTHQFLALGDSYTIGESVDPSERWPVQLAATMQAEGVLLDDPIIVAQTGWTTSNLLAQIEARKPQGPFDLVSLLIGVNNQYQGKDIESYREEFSKLLELSIALAGGDPSRVVVLSIPDWGVTPFADGRERDRIRAQINQFNRVNQTVSLAAGVQYVDIIPISRQAAEDNSLLAADNLHPSGKMYTAWVDLLIPTVKEILRPED